MFWYSLEENTFGTLDTHILTLTYTNMLPTKSHNNYMSIMVCRFILYYIWQRNQTISLRWNENVDNLSIEPNQIDSSYKLNSNWTELNRVKLYSTVLYCVLWVNSTENLQLLFVYRNTCGQAYTHTSITQQSVQPTFMLHFDLLICLCSGLMKRIWLPIVWCVCVFGNDFVKLKKITDTTFIVVLMYLNVEYVCVFHFHLMLFTLVFSSSSPQRKRVIVLLL